MYHEDAMESSSRIAEDNTRYSFGTFDIERVLKFGTELLGSSGVEYVLTDDMLVSTILWFIRWSDAYIRIWTAASDSRCSDKT